jgi:hypothetical protein
MRESLWRAIFFWVVVVFTLWAVWWNVHSLLMTAFAGIILLGALASFILPTQYKIGPEGASQERLTGRKSIEWSRVRSLTDEREGLFLSPYPVKSRLENFRGLYLPYRENREEIMAVVKMYASEASKPVDKEESGKRKEEKPGAPNYFGHRKRE